MKKYFLRLSVIVCLLLCTINAHAQTVGDYRTRAAGSWNNTSGWQVYQILVGWTNTTNIPNNTNGAISILHAITISGGLTVNADQVTISSGSLTISDGALNLFNGSGNDLSMTGGSLTLNNAASLINAPSGRL